MKTKEKVLSVLTITLVILLVTSCSNLLEDLQNAKKFYTINFNANGGTGTMTALKIAEEKVTVLPENKLTRSGYSFSGWALTVGATTVSYPNKANFIMPSNDVTLYAVWKKSGKSITSFKIDEYTGVITGTEIKVVVPYGTDKTVLKATFEASDKATVKIGITNQVSGTTVNNFTNPITYVVNAEDGTSQNYIVTVSYDAAYKITFDKNATDVTGTMEQIILGKNTSIELPKNTFTRTGYIYLGWSTDKTATEATYTDESSFAIGESDVTLYAVWQAGSGIAYKVEHYLQNIACSDYEKVADDTQNLQGVTGTNATYNAKIYVGFTYDSSKTEINGTTQTNGTINADGSTVIKLYYTRNEITLTFNLNGGSGNQSISGKYGSSVVPPINPTKTGYTFTSWSPSLPITYTSSDTNHTAQWEINTYTVTFDANGGIGSMSNQLFTYGETNILQKNSFTKTDYLFAGWNTQADGTGMSYTDEESFTVEISDVTLYAQWKLGMECTGTNVIQTIKNLTDGGEYTIIIEATNINLNNIVTAIKNKSSVKINLDLSKIQELTELSNGQFGSCNNLLNLTLPSTITTIQETAFYECKGLINIFVDSENTKFMSKDGVLFSKDEKTLIYYPAGRINSSYSIPEGTEILKKYAFRCSEYLVDIDIPNTVTTIETCVFDRCISLETVEIPSMVTDLLLETFWGCTNLRSITIPSSVTNIEFSFTKNCTSLAEIIVDPANTNYKSIDSVLFTFDGKKLIQYPIAKTNTSYEIPSDVTSIGSYTFYGCKNLTSITIPEKVTSIGNNAFYGCSALVSIQISENITKIESYTFYGCTALTSIIIPEKVTSIGNNAFYGCSTLTSITIPEKVTSIGNCAFIGCTDLSSISFVDDSTWYWITNITDWSNKENGTEISVSNPSTNAVTFNDITKISYYWYKL